MYLVSLHIRAIEYPVTCIRVMAPYPHPQVCRRCIRKMDHHCPWVNNCVGQQNQKFFILFTLYIFTISTLAMYMAVNKIVHCSDAEWSSKYIGATRLS